MGVNSGQAAYMATENTLIPHQEVKAGKENSVFILYT